MPSLLLVLAEIERRDLPGEFALLPYVESAYQTLPTKGKGPAGIWQLMAHTAIDRGLQVNRGYDQRLDILASTGVALDLIERYDREFSDWRLASMAFNAGEYRVKRALGAMPAAGLDAQRLARLKLTATTHQHLIRMLALSCIVSEPKRFGVELPAGDPDDLLIEVIPPAALDLRLAATLADLDLAEVLRFNAAWSGQARPHGPASRLLLPAQSADRLNQLLKDFPADMLGDWHTQLVDTATEFADLASSLGVAPHVLAVANRLDEGDRLQSGQLLLLPGAEPAMSLPANSQIHAIKPGDTLSAIARHYGIRLEDLLRWNGLMTHSILRPGSTLRIHEPSY
ncbi:MAG: LysM peptidoglycan-binding domain-containing protein [Xanthomonadales bacterium]|nr:LysM peptidoglycan-binding domain-containing protein [Xanthomonadales bacterium]